MNKQKFLSIGLGASALAGVLGGGAVMAEGNGGSAVAGITSLVQQANPAADDTRKAEQDAYLQSLATRLGISVDTLKTAIKDTSLEQLAKMVADGKLTQAQADALKAEIESGDRVFFGGIHVGGPGGPHGGVGFAHVDPAALASFLGIDTATLTTELQSGKTLATVASDHGKTRDALKAFLTDQLAKDLAAKVAAGKLTQAQADAEQTEDSARIDGIIDGTFMGGHREFGGPGRPGITPPPANGSSTGPATTSVRPTA